MRKIDRILKETERAKLVEIAEKNTGFQINILKAIW